MFDIRLSEEQRAYQRLAREFAEKEIKPYALELDKKPNWEERIPWETLKKGSHFLRIVYAILEMRSKRLRRTGIKKVATGTSQMVFCRASRQLSMGSTMRLQTD